MSGDAEKDEYSQFIQSHSAQLAFSGVPEHFWPTLHEKLKNEIFDAGEYFSMITQTEDEEPYDNAIFEPNPDGDSTAADMEVETESIEKGTPTKRLRAHDLPIEDTDIQSPTSNLKGKHGYLKHYGTGEKWKIIVSNENGMKADDGKCVFLIDHAWTYAANEARKYLTESPSLLHRMCNLMDIDYHQLSHDAQIEIVLRRMWRFNQTYSVQRPDLSVEEKMPVWYIMDEFGSRIGHSNSPNVRMVPFYYVPHGMSYTLLFPVKDAESGETITRDFVEGALYHHPQWRAFYLLPWSDVDFSGWPYGNVVAKDTFFTEGRNNEQLLDSPILMPENRGRVGKLKVYSEYSKVKEFLKHSKFEVIDSKEEADILWLHGHFKDYKTVLEKNPGIMINQIPFESVLTVKDLLAAAVQSYYQKRATKDTPLIDPTTLQSLPPWLATTYNLKTELPEFVSYFQNRTKMDMDNHWIIKPWNLARGLDTTVTKDLAHIIRLIGSGPKIACKYIENPVLFHRDDINSWVKFDLRFIVLLRSVKPLELYVYDRFWLRFALKQFSLDDLDDYEKHFTVFNYLDSSKIKQMFSKDFVEQFHRQYPHCNWNDVLKRIYEAFKELFEVACSENPPRGLAPYPQCRAMYGLDVMLRWTLNEKGEKIMQPVILEVNFTPDCGRACDYYPDFMDTVFETLFLDAIGKDLPVTLI